jgi:hypothetical protein
MLALAKKNVDSQKRGQQMISSTKALGLLTVMGLSASLLSGCAPTSSASDVKVETVACEDLSNPNGDASSYTISEWKKDSSMYSGFGLFRCEVDAFVTIEVSPLGKNLLAGETSISIGEEQLEFASFKSVRPADLQAESVLASNGHAIRVPANEKFQPFVELSQSQVTLTYGDEPVEMRITISANDKKSVTYKKVLRLATSS